MRRIAELDAAMAAAVEGFALPRVTMLETEYVRAVTEAELRWVDVISESLGNGSLTWSRDELEAALEASGGIPATAR